MLLLSCGSIYRANTCASAAIEALIRVDNIYAILLCDALYRTFGSASTASDASIGNLVSHFVYLLSIFLYCITK